jgi:hypothetical protein
MLLAMEYVVPIIDSWSDTVYTLLAIENCIEIVALCINVVLREYSGNT